MLSIRSDQVQSFGEHLQAAFLERMRAHVAQHFPSAAAAEDSRTKLQASVEAGQTLGLRSERELCGYLGLDASLDWKLRSAPEHSWAREILADEAQSPQQRLDLCLARALERLAEQVETARLDESRARAGARQAEDYECPELESIEQLFPRKCWWDDGKGPQTAQVSPPESLSAG